jgi:CheY-like chemotaxis protein
MIDLRWLDLAPGKHPGAWKTTPMMRSIWTRGFVTPRGYGPILIVEDDPDFRDGLAEVLTSSGYAVVEAANGAEGLHAAREHRPAVILLDMLMPVMDGARFRSEQLKDPAIADIPVIVITAADVEVAALRVSACFMKPFRMALLDEVRGRGAHS